MNIEQLLVVKSQKTVAKLLNIYHLKMRRKSQGLSSTWTTFLENYTGLYLVICLEMNYYQLHSYFLIIGGSCFLKHDFGN